MKNISWVVQFAYISAFAILAFGLFALVNPLVAVVTVGLDVFEEHIRGLSEARAGYGGRNIVLGACMLWALWRRPRLNMWLRLGGSVWMGSALIRIVSIFTDRIITPGNLIMLSVELFLGFSLLMASWYREGSFLDKKLRAVTEPERAEEDS